MEEEEYTDWELLQSSPRSEETARHLDEIEESTEGMIRADYFSLDNRSIHNRFDDLSEDGSVKSENPSWIDPGPEAPYGMKHSSEFWSDTSSDRSEDRKVVDLNLKNQLDFVDALKSDVDVIDYANRQVGLTEYGEIEVENQDLGRHLAVSVENTLDSVQSGVIDNETENFLGESVEKGVEWEGSGEFHGGNQSGEEIFAEENSVQTETPAIISNVKSGGEEEKKAIIWWKVPFEFLKYCVFKASPVWSFSVAATVMGFIILGRRLYKMKKKSRNLPLKVAVHDKVSQGTSRAARLNEAFSVVRAIPIIRPMLPAPGINQWPVMSLR